MKSKLKKDIAKIGKTNYNKGEMPMANEIVKKLGMKSDIVFKAFLVEKRTRNF